MNCTPQRESTQALLGPDTPSQGRANPNARGIVRGSLAPDIHHNGLIGYIRTSSACLAMDSHANEIEHAVAIISAFSTVPTVDHRSGQCRLSPQLRVDLITQTTSKLL